MAAKLAASIFLLLLQLSSFSNSAPLSTSSKWIIRQSTGKRVKLACANWVSHLQPMIAEGLEKKPVGSIAAMISGQGFNCVRFTWPTFMFTRPNYSSLTVSASLDHYNLTAAKSGIAQNNPWALKLTTPELHMAVVTELGKQNLMVILDNHVSEPGWCCGNDGNGFFGDADFDPDEWTRGLATVARIYNGNSAVVGMSLRNELRGSRQNQADWYKYMQQGADAVHKEAPDFLVIISGLNFDTNLGFLKSKPLGLNLNNKLVYEGHWYTFGIPTEKWTSQTNTFCASATKTARDNYFFLTTGDNSVPVFLSEFGMDQRGGDEGQNRYMVCVLQEMAEKDIDWALWAFQGSYILRQGVQNLEEVYGVMDLGWNGARNPDYMDRFQLLRQVNQDPTVTRAIYYKMFHPQSGECVVIRHNEVVLGSCKAASRWGEFRDGESITLDGSARCLGVGGVGGAVGVSNDCSSKWKYTSSSGFQLAGKSRGGEYLCMAKNGSDIAVVTEKCLCVGDDLGDLPTCGDNPQVQWFKLVPANV